MNFQKSFQEHYQSNKSGFLHLDLSQEHLNSYSVLEQELFPSPKEAHWEYTNLKDFLKDYVLKGRNSSVTPCSLKKLNQEELQKKLLISFSENFVLLVFYDGIYSDELSLIPAPFKNKITCSPLREKKDAFEKMQAQCLEKHYLYHLSSLECLDGTYIQVHEDVEIIQPIYVLCYQSKSDSTLQTNGIYFDISPKASASLIIDTIADKDIDYSSNLFQILNVQSNASLTHYQVCRGAQNSIHLSNIHAFVESQGTYRYYDYTFSAKCRKSMVAAYLRGEGAHADFFGVVALSGDTHVDNTTHVEHLVANSSSNQHYRYLLDGNAVGVFDGMIRIIPGAQNVLSKQYNHTVLLDSNAKMYTKPQLDVWANQVQSAHGATIGYLDEEQAFYLRSRGLNERDARRLLLEAFISGITQSMPCKDLHLPLQNMLLQNILHL